MSLHARAHEIIDMLSQEPVTTNIAKKRAQSAFLAGAEAYVESAKRQRVLKKRQKIQIPEKLRALADASSKAFDSNVMQEFVFLRTYARWLPEEGRRETWPETVQRYMDFMHANLGECLSQQEYADVHAAILNFDVMPSMRLMQFAGLSAARCNVCAFNCAYVAPENFKDLADIMYISMSGSGMGFSVEFEHVKKFPCVKDTTGRMYDYKIPDSKEGWCDAFLFALQTWYNGDDVEFDYSELRPAGARLKTSGGTSSGPEPLKDLMRFTREIIQQHAGSRLSPQNLHDIICKIGQIVVAGGVRRSALISFSDLNDTAMRDAKTGEFWMNPEHAQRSMANNSAVYTEEPSQIQLMREWLTLAESGTGERGIFNVSGLANVLPTRRSEFLGSEAQSLRSNPCVTADTWVLTVEGPKRVADLISRKLDVIVNGKPHAMISEGFFHTGNKLVYEVTTQHGFSMKLTANHKLFKHAQDWLELSELKPGDKIALSQHEFTLWDGEGDFREGEYQAKVWLRDRRDSLESLIRGKSRSFYYGFISAVIGENIYWRFCVEVRFSNIQDAQTFQRMLCYCGIIGSIMPEIYLVRLDEANFHACLKHISARDGTQGCADIMPKKEEFWDTIQSITEIGYEDVYDVTIANAHEFCANGIRAHNCGEILLQSKQFCNLTEVICRADDARQSLLRKIRMATIIGTYQASLTNFKYISDTWRTNQQDERLLGVSLTGMYDVIDIFTESLLRELRNASIAVNATYAQRLGIRAATAITTVKPSGTVSQLVNAASGIHPRFAKYYIRRIRIAATDPLLQLMIDSGYKCQPEVGQTADTATTFVLEFPVKAPKHALTVKDVTALDQLAFWKIVKTQYTEHNPSVTIYVRPNEWISILAWISTNWQYITGLTFLPYDDHVYELAPYQAITKEEYTRRLESLSHPDFAKLMYYETTDTTDVKRELACAGGVCEL